jgi:hypothetical protein
MQILLVSNFVRARLAALRTVGLGERQEVKMQRHGRSLSYRTGWAHPVARGCGALVGGFAAFLAYAIASFLADGLGPDRPPRSNVADAVLFAVPLACFALVGLATWHFAGAVVEFWFWLGRTREE